LSFRHCVLLCTQTVVYFTRSCAFPIGELIMEILIFGFPVEAERLFQPHRAGNTVADRLKIIGKGTWIPVLLIGDGVVKGLHVRFVGEGDDGHLRILLQKRSAVAAAAPNAAEHFLMNDVSGVHGISLAASG